MNPILHIGYPKTGTTWFQKYFYPYVNNIAYLHEHDIRKHIIDAEHFDRDKIARLLQAGKRPVLCEENLVYDKKEKGQKLEEYARRLQSVFPQATIVVFIRHQAHMAASLYMEYVKMGGNFSAQKFIFPENFDPYILENLDYYKTINIYASAFGKENVKVFLYEDFDQDNRAFMEQYVKMLELNVSVEYLKFPQANKSYAGCILELAKCSNLFTRKMFSEKKCLVHVPLWFEFSRKCLEAANRAIPFKRYTTSKILGDDLMNNIQNRFGESNNKLMQDFGITALKKYNYPL